MPKGVAYRRALLTGAAMLLAPISALAQEAPATDAPAAKNDDSTVVVVTGSRLRGAAPVGSAVLSVGREEISKSPALTTDRIIKEIPQVFDLGVSENSRGQSGGSGNITYGNSVNLRGIGPYSTLVLVDGHRVVSNSRSIDPSVMPSLGLERIEVVADGASAIYGSDAVAGVVNLIPRRSLNGGEAVARYGFADGFNEKQIAAAVGKTWDSGQVMFAIEKVKRSALKGEDRDFFVSDQRGFGGGNYAVTKCAPGTLKAGGVSYAMPSQLTQANASSLVAGTSNTCDDLIGQDLVPEQDYLSMNSTFTQDVTPWMTVFADAFYSRRDFVRNPSASSAVITVPQTNAWFVRPNGFAGTSYTIDYNFVNDLPFDQITGHAQSWQITPGLRFKLPHDWQLEVVYGVGRTHDNSIQTRGLNNAALNAALASNDPTKAFDPYGGHRTAANVLAGISDQLFVAPTIGRFKGGEVRLNGALFSLPGGEVKVGAGIETQANEVDLGLQRGAPGTAMTFRYFKRDVSSVYVETLIPIFGMGNAVPGFQKLDLSLAVRSDDYSDVGKTTNPKYGVNWTPVDGLTLKASYGTSFRAPIIPQIYGNSNGLFGQSYQNPAGGAPLTGFAYSGTNLDLKPETAETQSFTVEWKPTPTFNASLTYFDVLYENQVTSYLSDLALLTRSSQFDGTGIILTGTAARDRVLELIGQGIPLLRGSYPGGNPNNVTLYVDGRNKNLGVSTTRGFDFAASWRLPTDDLGNFRFYAGGTYLTFYEAAITPSAPKIDLLNTIFNPLKLKMRASVAWDKGPFSAQATVQHVGTYDNTAVTPIQKVESYSPVDLYLAWNVGERLNSDLTLGLDVTDLFDVGPPYVNLAPSVNGSGGYDATAASPMGRKIAVSLRAKW